MLQRWIYMDACISNNFIFIFFIIVKNYRKVKRPETKVAESIRRLSIPKHEVYPQQKSFRNGIYLQSVNMI